MWRWWTCRRLRPRLVDAAAGTLDASERARVAAHLARCGRCAADVAALNDVPPLLHGAQEPPLGEEFWRSQRAAIMREVHGLPEPGVRTARVQPWPPVGGRSRWVTWAPALVASMAVVMVLALRLGPRSAPGPAAPATEIEALDDPTLLSLSDLAGFSSPEMERAAEAVEEAGPLPELSNDELDALAQLVGVRER
jgi:anti-sigma factor RsiW